MSFLRQQRADEEYQLYARLSGTAGPINTLAFAPDAKLLASGGDDQKVRVWDVTHKRIHQVIGDELERWGQITCIQWLTIVSPNDTLCFGTGRGLIVIYQKTKEADHFKEISSTAVMPFNEPIEAIDYDKNKGRLALSSHSGKIRVCHIEKNGTVLTLWSENWNEIKEVKGVIPRSVQFTEKGENLVIFGLESGVVVSKLAATGVDNWSKVLKSSIGNVSFSANQKWLLVDNLTKGFDLYEFPHTSPSESFSVSRTKAFVHQGIFLEGGMAVACGSDHGLVHIFSRGTSTCLQRLKHGSRKTMIQVLDARSAMNVHLIASGTDEKKPVIHIWVKKAQGRQDQQRICRCNSITILIFLNILLILIATMWMVGIHNQDWLNNQPKASARNHNQDWLNSQLLKASAGRSVVSRAPIKSQSEHEKFQKADHEGFLKRNGINLNDPDWKRHTLDVIQRR